jgi:hypothetical protein
MPEIEDAELERLRAAEEVCWTLMLVFGLDLLPPKDVNEETRKFIAEPMMEWSRLCVEQGLMQEEAVGE